LVFIPWIIKDLVAIQMKKPNFFIVGMPRSGTTALYKFLNQHPDIFLPEQKELCYFENDLNEERIGYHGYLRPFFKAKKEDFLSFYDNVNKERAIGDISPDYAFSKVAAKKISDFNPKAKIIFILREPVDFMFSWYCHALERGWETKGSFKKALSLENKRKEGKNIPKYVREPSALFYKEKADYVPQIKRYLNLFPKENILILFYDDFEENNLKVLKKIFKFLGVDKSFVPKMGRYNKSKNVTNKYILGLILKLGKNKLRKILPKKIRAKILKRLRSHAVKNEKKRMDLSERKEIMLGFKGRVVELNTLLHENKLLDKNLDLVKFWGYDNV
jgi:hypothetical protein